MSRYVGVMYRIKSLLPAISRIQIFHSFVQSYINYCSLVWGFAAKSNIDSLFTGQKKGLRAAMPGYVNYFYKDGVTPSHTKQSFNDMKILTVHNQWSTGIPAPAPDTAGIRVFSPAPAPVNYFLKSRPRPRPRLVYPNPGPGPGFLENFTRILPDDFVFLVAISSLNIW